MFLFHYEALFQRSFNFRFKKNTQCSFIYVLSCSWVMFGECAIINIYLVREGVQIRCCYCRGITLWPVISAIFCGKLHAAEINSKIVCKIKVLHTCTCGIYISSHILTVTERYSCTFRHGRETCRSLNIKQRTHLLLPVAETFIFLQEYKCLLFSPKPQKFHTAEITCYTVYSVDWKIRRLIQL